LKASGSSGQDVEIISSTFVWPSLDVSEIMRLAFPPILLDGADEIGDRPMSTRKA